jgi:hypothetical protein
MRHESGPVSMDRPRPASRTVYSENLRNRIVEQHSRGAVPSAIAVTQGVTFGTVRDALRDVGTKIPRYLSWDDSAFGDVTAATASGLRPFGKVERCSKCGHETS